MRAIPFGLAAFFAVGVISAARAEPVEIPVSATVKNTSDLFDIYVLQYARFGTIYQSPVTECEYEMSARATSLTVRQRSHDPAGTTSARGTPGGCRAERDIFQSAQFAFDCPADAQITFTLGSDTLPTDPVYIDNRFLTHFAIGSRESFLPSTGTLTVTCDPTDRIGVVSLGPRLIVKQGQSLPSEDWTGNLTVSANF